MLKTTDLDHIVPLLSRLVSAIEKIANELKRSNDAAESGSGGFLPGGKIGRMI